ncbi:transcriptional regulator [Ferrovibrio sp. MS7]|uniref:HVO_A0114 family putative DNA-binding protein n=1 Tax=Ferrovibrio plantarum TaxID=3119164 RepID=UPI003134CE9B
MRTLTIDIAAPDDMRRQMAERMAAATKGRKLPPRISFASRELLWQVLAPRRWSLLEALAGAGPLGVREAARKVGRDPSGVHGDIKALLAAGLLWKREDGKIEFPFDAIHVDFTVRAA